MVETATIALSIALLALYSLLCLLALGVLIFARLKLASDVPWSLYVYMTALAVVAFSRIAFVSILFNQEAPYKWYVLAAGLPLSAFGFTVFYLVKLTLVMMWIYISENAFGMTGRMCTILKCSLALSGFAAGCTALIGLATIISLGVDAYGHGDMDTYKSYSDQSHMLVAGLSGFAAVGFLLYVCRIVVARVLNQKPGCSASQFQSMRQRAAAGVAGTSFVTRCAINLLLGYSRWFSTLVEEGPTTADLLEYVVVEVIPSLVIVLCLWAQVMHMCSKPGTGFSHEAPLLMSLSGDMSAPDPGEPHLGVWEARGASQSSTSSGGRASGQLTTLSRPLRSP